MNEVESTSNDFNVVNSTDVSPMPSQEPEQKKTIEEEKVPES